MNLRRRAKPEVFGFQIAPMVDILLVLLVFFIVTWNFALSENELDVKIPSAAHAQEPHPWVGQIVINVKSDGSLIFQRKPISSEAMLAKLKELAGLYPDQAVILRGDQTTNYKSIVDVLDLCRQANIWNVAFATAAPSAK